MPCTCLDDRETATAAWPARMSAGRQSFLEWNAEQLNPMPVCRHCEFPFRGHDADVFDGSLCGSCGWARLERRVMKLIHAKGKKTRKRALKRLMKIAK